MDLSERIRLKKIYAEMSEEQIVDIVIEDAAAYEKEPYESYKLLLEEACKRKLTDRLDALKKQHRERAKEEELSRSNQWISVYTFFDEVEKISLESLLQQETIPYEIVYRCENPYDGLFKPALGLGEFLVREDCVEKTRIIISEYKKEAESS